MVDHPAYIRLVDAHAEGNGGDHDLRVVADERLLIVASRVRIEARMVGEGADAVGLQPRGQLIHAPSRQTIDDSGAALARLGQKFVVGALILRPDPVEEVGAIEAGEVDRGLAQRQLRDDVGANPRSRRRREREDRNLGVPTPQRRELPVIRPEIMPPFRDAMRLVDDERIDAAPRAEPCQRTFEELAKHEPLRRQIDQLVVAA